jgi:hypothetical protein
MKIGIKNAAKTGFGGWQAFKLEAGLGGTLYLTAQKRPAQAGRFF